GKEHSGIDRLSADKQMMSPDQKAINGNRNTRKSHERVTENLFPREGGNQFADDAHRRQNHNVDSRMRVEPEKMLEKNRVATQIRIEDANAKHSFQAKQNNRHSDYRRTENLNQTGCIMRPYEKRQTKPFHSRRPHCMNGDNEVQSGQDGRKSANKNPNRHRNDIGI